MTYFVHVYYVKKLKLDLDYQSTSDDTNREESLSDNNDL